MKCTGKKTFSIYIICFFLSACHHPLVDKQAGDRPEVFKEGEFGYDFQFLKKSITNKTVRAVKI